MAKKRIDKRGTRELTKNKSLYDIIIIIANLDRASTHIGEREKLNIKNNIFLYFISYFSMLDIVKKYNLSGDSVLKNWLKWYNTSKWNIKMEEFMAREKISKSFKLSLVLQVLQ